MLFYNFDLLDHLIKTNLMNNLNSEKNTLKKIIDLYVQKKDHLLTLTNRIVEIADSMDQKHLEKFYEVISSLKKSFEDINFIHNLASKLDQDLSIVLSLYDKNIEDHIDEIKAILVEYNKQREELSNKIMEFENTNTSIIHSAIELSFQGFHKKIKKQNKATNKSFTKDPLKIDVELNPYDNNVLIVSEKEQKAYLPFFYSEIKQIYQNSPHLYETLQDVVDDLYIIPLKQFKNSSIARFKESFHLIRNKEKGSITKALDLALELMFKYELNPVIISACRNLDELDIYLDCLEENELEDFSCFEIKFEIMPELSKKSKKNTFLF